MDHMELTKKIIRGEEAPGWSNDWEWGKIPEILEKHGLSPDDVADLITGDSSPAGTLLMFYKDGQEIYSQAKPGTLVATNPGVRIGLGNQSLDAAGGTNQPFHGLLDDVRIYQRGLSPTEVLLLAGQNPPSVADINLDQVVNFTDFQALAEEWLR